MAGKKQWVVPNGDEWAVRGEGNQRATSIHRTQKDAINAAKEIAKNQKSEVIIQNQKGQIRERNTYGDDPFPPKG